MKILTLFRVVHQITLLHSRAREKTVVEDVVVEKQKPKSMYRIPSLGLLEALSEVPENPLSPREELARSLMGSPPHPNKKAIPKLQRQSSKFSCMNMTTSNGEFKKLCKVVQKSIDPEEKGDESTLKLGGVIKVENRKLEEQYFKARKLLKQGFRSEYAFHGTRSQNSVFSICEYGLLPVGHLDNPSSAVSRGRMGHPSRGVNLTRSINSAVRHSNFTSDLDIGETAQILVFELAVGNTKRISRSKTENTPKSKRLVHKKDGVFQYDSYTAREDRQIYLTKSELCHPVYILEVHAVVIEK